MMMMMMMIQASGPSCSCARWVPNDHWVQKNINVEKGFHSQGDLGFAVIETIIDNEVILKFFRATLFSWSINFLSLESRHQILATLLQGHIARASIPRNWLAGSENKLSIQRRKNSSAQHLTWLRILTLLTNDRNRKSIVFFTSHHFKYHSTNRICHSRRRV